MGLSCPYIPGRYPTFLRKIAGFYLFGKVVMFFVSRYPRTGGLHDPMFSEAGAYAYGGNMRTQGHSMYDVDSPVGCRHIQYKTGTRQYSYKPRDPQLLADHLPQTTCQTQRPSWKRSPTGTERLKIYTKRWLPRSRLLITYIASRTSRRKVSTRYRISTIWIRSVHT